MKKSVKVLPLILLVAVVMIALSACGDKNKVTKENAAWVKVGYNYSAVVKQLGSPNDSLEQQNAYYWFDGAKNIEDAVKKLASGKIVTLIVIMFNDELDGENRVTRVQYTTLTEENKAILTTDVVRVNINVTEDKSEVIKKGDSYYAVINVLGIENTVYNYADSKCCYWFDGALNFEDAYARAENGETIRYLEIAFTIYNDAVKLRYEEIRLQEDA